LCATPDHLHAYVSVTCRRQGKHVYCEKRLTNNIAEARHVAKVASETGVANQLGNQGYASDGMRQTVEWNQAGAIGPIREVHAWSGTGRWNPQLTTDLREHNPTPAGVNWDLSIGPQQPRPYSSLYCPVSRRDFRDFGTGPLGDIGCHDRDAAFWALDLSAPTTVEGHPAGRWDDTICPSGEVGYYDLSACGQMPPVRLTWYDGGSSLRFQPPCPRGAHWPIAGSCLSAIVCGGAGGPPKLYPESLDRQFKRPEPSIPRVAGHHRDWIDAVKGGKSPSSNFAYGARLTEIVLLGVAAVLAGRPLTWNSKEMRFEGNEFAIGLLDGTYHPGWEIPA
jgi:predicted dehydrogenase